MPEIVLVELDPELARTEPDPEIQDLIRASAGLNLALDYLPGAVTFDPLAAPARRRRWPRRIVWFDAFVTNVDRTPRNTNMLVLASAALADRPRRRAVSSTTPGTSYRERSRRPFPLIKDHVLLPLAERARARPTPCSRAQLTPDADRSASSALVPDDWLDGRAGVRRRTTSSARPTSTTCVGRLRSAARLRRGGGPCPIACYV